MNGHFIEFPNLGWRFPLSPDLVSFHLFGTEITIKWYGVLIAIGFLLAMIYALRRARQFELDPDRMIDVVLVSALFAFVGARLYYVVFSEDRADFFSDPITILQVWKGGLAIYGGILFAFITAIWMCRVRKVNTLAMLSQFIRPDFIRSGQRSLGYGSHRNRCDYLFRFTGKSQTTGRNCENIRSGA